MLVPSLPQSAGSVPSSRGLNARFKLRSLGNASELPQYAGTEPCSPKDISAPWLVLLLDALVRTRAGMHESRQFLKQFRSIKSKAPKEASILFFSSGKTLFCRRAGTLKHNFAADRIWLQSWHGS